MFFIINKVKEYLIKYDSDALIIKSDSNRLWATGFQSSFGIVIINDNSINLFLDDRYIEKAKDTIIDSKINIFLYKNFDSILNFCKQNKISSILLEGDYINYNEYNFYKKNFSNITCIQSKNLRIEKSENEIQKIKKSADIAVKTIEWIRGKIKPNKYSEREISALIIFKMITLGATKPSFDPIVASGINGAYPHHIPSDKIIAKGEYVTIDIGCVYEGYCSDITRTFLIGKKPNNAELKKVYSIVLKANQAAINAVSSCKTGKEIDNICQKVISDAGYSNYFNHATGHGIGIEVHEYPIISKTSDNILNENSIFTIEPGIYLPGIGGVRIEDMILLTKNKKDVIVLTDKAIK